MQTGTDILAKRRGSYRVERDRTGDFRTKGISHIAGVRPYNGAFIIVCIYIPCRGCKCTR